MVGLTALTGGALQSRNIVVPEGALRPAQLSAVAQGSTQLLVVVPGGLCQDTWPRGQELGKRHPRQRERCVGITGETENQETRDGWRGRERERESDQIKE